VQEMVDVKLKVLFGKPRNKLRQSMTNIKFKKKIKKQHTVNLESTVSWIFASFSYFEDEIKRKRKQKNQSLHMRDIL
jgi:hypothetical protein